MKEKSRKFSKKGMAIYFLATGNAALLGILHFASGSSLLALWELRWRAAVNTFMAVVMSLGMMLFVIGLAVVLFVRPKCKGFKRALTIMLALACLYSLTGIFVVAGMSIGFSHVSESVIEANGSKYVKVEDDYMGNHGLCYEYHGPFLMSREYVEELSRQ